MSNEVSQNTGFPFAIKKVNDISFFVNEQLYVHDPKKIVKIEMAQNLGTNVESNLVSFTLRAFLHYQDSPPDHILADIHVQNIFEVPELKSFVKDDALMFPVDILISMISMAISHTRALLARNIAGTPYQEIIIPVTNPVEVTRHFFPTLFQKEIDEFLKKQGKE